MEQYKIIDAMLYTLCSLVKPNELLSIINELIQRIDRQPVCPSKYGDLIYGTLVITFGEYALCPTAGRIDEQHKTMILNILHNELADYAYRTKGWYEDCERSNK